MFGNNDGYGDFSSMEMDRPMQQRPGGGRQQRGGYGAPMMVPGGGGGGMVQQEIINIKAAVAELQQDRDGLRNGIRKLKVENSRLKQRLRKMAEVMKSATGETMDVDADDYDDLDFDALKEFLLLGGPLDPLGLRYDAKIIDADKKEHKSAERYFWYKMAETFKDAETAEKIRSADTTAAAEEAMKALQGFDEAVWNGLKMKYWEEAQRLKLEQNRDIQNLLVYTGTKYLAVASQDKVFGTGWRRGRDESSRPRMWDGENGGGKALMRMRDAFKKDHSWQTGEEAAAEKTFNELKRSAWSRDAGRERSTGRGGFRGRAMGGGFRGGFRGRGRGSSIMM